MGVKNPDAIEQAVTKKAGSLTLTGPIVFYGSV